MPAVNSVEFNIRLRDQLTREVQSAAASVKQSFKVIKTSADETSQSGVLGLERMEGAMLRYQHQLVAVRRQVNDNRAAQLELNQSLKSGKISVEEHARSMAGLQSKEKELAAQMKLVSGQLKTVRQDIGAMNFAARDAVGDAGMLLGTFGVQMPMALSNLASKFRVVQGAIGAALPVALVTAAAGGVMVALVNLYTHIDVAKSKWIEFSETVRRYGFREAVADLTGLSSLLAKVGVITEKHHDDLKRQRRNQIAAESYDRAEQYRREAELATLEGPARIRRELELNKRARGVARDPAEIAALEAKAKAEIDAYWRPIMRQRAADARQAAHDLAMIGLEGTPKAIREAAEYDIRERNIKAGEQGYRLPREVAAAIRAKAEHQIGQQQFAEIEARRELAQQVDAVRRHADEIGDRNIIRNANRAAQRDIDAFYQQVIKTKGLGLDQAKDMYSDFAISRARQAEAEITKIHEQANEQVIALEEQAQIDRLDISQRGIARVVAAENARFRHLKQQYDDGLISAEQFERARAALAVSAQDRIKEAVRQTYDAMRNEAGQFFDAMLGGRSGVGQFFKSTVLGQLRKIFSNVLTEQVLAPILSRIPKASDPNSTWGKILKGTIFGADSIRPAIDENTLRTADNTQKIAENNVLLDRLNGLIGQLSQSGLGGGLPAGAGQFAMHAFGGQNGGWTSMAQGMLPLIGLAAGGKKGFIGGSAASGFMQGIKTGGLKGGLRGAGISGGMSAMMAPGGLLQHVGGGALAGASMGSMVGPMGALIGAGIGAAVGGIRNLVGRLFSGKGPTVEERNRKIEETLARNAFSMPERRERIYGASALGFGRADYGWGGEARVIVQQTMNVQTYDTRDFVRNQASIAKAARRAMLGGDPALALAVREMAS